MSKLNKKTPKDKKVLVQARLPFKILSEHDHSIKVPQRDGNQKTSSNEKSNSSKTLSRVDAKDDLTNLESKSNEIISIENNESPIKRDISDNEDITKADHQDHTGSTPESTIETEDDNGKSTEKIHFKFPLSSNKKKRKLSNSETKTPNSKEAQNNGETTSKKMKISPTNEDFKLEKGKTEEIIECDDEEEMKIIDLSREEDPSVDLPSLTESVVNSTAKENLSKSPTRNCLDAPIHSSIARKLEYKKGEEKFEEDIQDDTESDVEMTPVEPTIVIIEENSSSEEPDPTEELKLLDSTASPLRNNSNRIEDEAQQSTPQSSCSAKISKSKKSLTPARQLKKEEFEKKREEKRKQKEEQERKREEEKTKQKEEQEKKREEKKKQKEEREKMIQAKNEERRQKMEERKKREEQKEEERRRKEEEKRKKEQEREEIEHKKRKEAEHFTKFFVPTKLSKESCDSPPESSSVKLFMPFRIKDGMKLAPPQRRKLSTDSKIILDKIIGEGGKNDKKIQLNDLYLAKLKTGDLTPGSCPKTLLSEDTKDDVTIVEDELEDVGQAIDDGFGNPVETFRAKFLLFNENQRPPYYGTWRKKTNYIKPRRPFAKDEDLFNYEIDSDEEWEEEEPGESLLDSDEDKESEDDYEVDNEFFVPHGHLSDEELKNDEDMDDINDSQAQEKKLKLRQQEFDEEMNRKTEKIKPRLIGTIWEDENGNQPESCPNVIWKSLSKRAMIFKNVTVILKPEESEKMETGSPEKHQQQSKKKLTRKTHLSDVLIMDLIRLVHGNRHKKEFMIKEFQMYLGKQLNSDTISSEYSKSLIRENIDNIAKWGCTEIKVKGKKKKRLCWIVKPEIIEKYEIKDISLSNKWEYILKPKTNIIDGEEINHESLDKMETENTNKNEKFDSSMEAEELARTAADKEKKMFIKNINLSPSGNLNVKSPIVKVPKSKKRVSILASGPLGQELPNGKQNTLISNFLKSSCESNNTNKCLSSIKRIKSNEESASSASTSTMSNQNIQNSTDGVILIE